MKIEIWSDIACPFCYIGKRRFEKALAQFNGADQVEVVWRSFQLDPSVVTDPTANAVEMLANKKGWSLAQTRQIQANVVQMAAGEGLDYHFDNQVVANTFDAHRFAHLAQQHGKQNEAEERLFAAHFCEGKNIADPAVLAEMGEAMGIPSETVQETLASDAFAQAVRDDIHMAEQFGISGVPFFVIDRKYGVSGAQSVEVFLGALERAVATV